MKRDRVEYYKHYYQENKEKLKKQNEENYDKKRKCYAVKVGDNFYCYKQKKDVEVLVIKYSEIKKHPNYIRMF